MEALYSSKRACWKYTADGDRQRGAGTSFFSIFDVVMISPVNCSATGRVVTVFTCFPLQFFSSSLSLSRVPFLSDEKHTIVAKLDNVLAHFTPLDGGSSTLHTSRLSLASKHQNLIFLFHGADCCCSCRFAYKALLRFATELVWAPILPKQS